MTAATVLSLYAEATNAVLIRSASWDLGLEQPEASPLQLVFAAIDRPYEGLVSTLVNIVNAAGLAGTIALPELVSAVNAVLPDSGGDAVMMNLLPAFYFLSIFAVMRPLRAGRILLRQFS